MRAWPSTVNGDHSRMFANPSAQRPQDAILACHSDGNSAQARPKLHPCAIEAYARRLHAAAPRLTQCEAGCASARDRIKILS